jgi:hypothetical protein
MACPSWFGRARASIIRALDVEHSSTLEYISVGARRGSRSSVFFVLSLFACGLGRYHSLDHGLAAVRAKTARCKLLCHPPRPVPEKIVGRPEGTLLHQAPTYLGTPLHPLALQVGTYVGGGRHSTRRGAGRVGSIIGGRSYHPQPSRGDRTAITELSGVEYVTVARTGESDGGFHDGRGNPARKKTTATAVDHRQFSVFAATDRQKRTRLGSG